MSRWPNMVMQLILGYNNVLAIKFSPDEDRMYLQYVWYLAAPERQALPRIAKGCNGCQRPAVGSQRSVQVRCGTRGSERDGRRGGTGGTKSWPGDPRRCWSARLGHRGPTNGTVQAKRNSCKLAQPVLPAGHARWSLRPLAREQEAREVVTEISYETVRRPSKKRTDALASGLA